MKASTPINNKISHALLISLGILLLGFIGFTCQSYLHPAKPAAKLTALTKSRIEANMLKMPLYFETNQGQMDGQVNFLTRSRGYNLFFTKDELVFVFSNSAGNPAKPDTANKAPEVIRAKFVGADAKPIIVGADKLAAKSNYFIGNDPKKWHTSVPNYGKVNYKNLYPGIDATFYGNQTQLEYDIRVAPGASPKAFQLNFSGVKNIVINKQGDLLLNISGKTLSMHKPIVYQEIDGRKHGIEGSFVVKNNQVSFNIGAYDNTKPLVIDPILYYSTYLGGGGGESSGYGIAVDSSGSAYVTGETKSASFPTKSAYQSVVPFGTSGFITKINNNGDGIEYSTYLGGFSNVSGARGIAVDGSGNAYITGYTKAGDFPTVNQYMPCPAGAAQPSRAFMSKLGSAGNTLLYSTYLTNTISNINVYDVGTSIAVDSSNMAYITGFTTASNNFPVKNAYQSTNSADQTTFMAKFDPSSSGEASLIYSTLFGHIGKQVGGPYISTYARDISVDASGQVYIVGESNSRSDYFPMKKNWESGAPISYVNNNRHIYLAKFNPTLSGDSSLIFSSFFGGGSAKESGGGIAVDSLSDVYITGYTQSDATYFPLLHPYQSTLNGVQNAFVAKLHEGASNLELVYSTYLGGSGTDSADDIALDSSLNVYLTGITTSSNFPTLNPFQNSLKGTQDAFVTKVNAYVEDQDLTLSYSTYLGGESGTNFGYRIAVNGSDFYISGSTTSLYFPTTTNTLYHSRQGTTDAIIARFSETPTYAITKHQITSPDKNGTVDVFGLMTTANGKLFANARYELDNNKSRQYMSNDPATIPTIACSTDTFKSSGWFGIDKISSSAYIPTNSDVELLAATTTACIATPAFIPASDDATIFLRASANNLYYVVNDYYGLGNDALKVSNNGGSSWDYISIPGKITSMDGDDLAQNVFITRAGALYFCNDYPDCENLSASTSFFLAHIVAYKYIPSNITTLSPKNLLVVANTNGRLFIAASPNLKLPSTPVSNIDALLGRRITSVAIDNDYIYITSYTTATKNKMDTEDKYAPKNLIANSCLHSSNELIQAIDSSTLTIGKLYFRQVSDSVTTAEMHIIGTVDFSNPLYAFSKGILGVNLDVNSATGKADHIYVPSLSPVCNAGGYTMLTPSGS